MKINTAIVPGTCLECGEKVWMSKQVGCEVFDLDHKFKGYICIKHAKKTMIRRRDVRNDPFTLTKSRMPKKVKREIQEELRGS